MLRQPDCHSGGHRKWSNWWCFYLFRKGTGELNEILDHFCSAPLEHIFPHILLVMLRIVNWRRWWFESHLRAMVIVSVEAVACLPGHAVVKYTQYCNITQASGAHPASQPSKHSQFHWIQTEGVFYSLLFCRCSRVAEDHDRSPKHIWNYCQCGHYPRVKDVCRSCWRFRSGAGSPGWPQRWLCESCGGDTGPQARTSQGKGEDWRPWGQVTVAVLLTWVLISRCYCCLSDWIRLKCGLGGDKEAGESLTISVPSLSVLCFLTSLLVSKLQWSLVMLLSFSLLVYGISKSSISWWVPLQLRCGYNSKCWLKTFQVNILIFDLVP